MLRQLLTLLAVLTGLTATAVPAHALESGVQAVEIAQDAAGSMAQAEAVIGSFREGCEKIAEIRQGLRPGPAIAVITPTVILRVDRAHE